MVKEFSIQLGLLAGSLILLKNLVHQALPVALDDELGRVVDYIGAVAIIVEAITDVLGEADATVELAQGNQAGIRGNLASLEIHIDSVVMTEGECCLDVALCSHGGSLCK